MYIYDKDKTVLYFQDISFKSLRRKISIESRTLNKYLNQDDLYLDTFVITDYLIPEAQNTDLTIEGFINLLGEKRSQYRRDALRAKEQVNVWLRHAKSKDIIKFDARNDALRSLRERGYTVDKDTARKYTDTGKVYKDHY